MYLNYSWFQKTLKSGIIMDKKMVFQKYEFFKTGSQNDTGF